MSDVKIVYLTSFHQCCCPCCAQYVTWLWIIYFWVQFPVCSVVWWGWSGSVVPANSSQLCNYWCLPWLLASAAKTEWIREPPPLPLPSIRRPSVSPRWRWVPRCISTISRDRAAPAPNASYSSHPLISCCMPFMTIQSTETDTTTFSYQIQINFDSLRLWVWWNIIKMLFQLITARCVCV